MLIPIETHRSVIFQGVGPDPLSILWIRTWIFFHEKSIALCELQFESVKPSVSTSNVMLCDPRCKYHAREPLYSNRAVIVLWLQSTSAQHRIPSF